MKELFKRYLNEKANSFREDADFWYNYSLVSPFAFAKGNLCLALANFYKSLAELL